mmetsp:Transcript_43233/g.94158  ORF Transcript_43233/g.94158 Transcript_43233/m.94158 type:complete len:91 (-) Transcript_43233:132-404(-)
MMHVDQNFNHAARHSFDLAVEAGTEQFCWVCTGAGQKRDVAPMPGQYPAQTKEQLPGRAPGKSSLPTSCRGAAVKPWQQQATRSPELAPH